MPTKKKAAAPKRKKVRQGHKLVWLTLIIIAIPILIVGYVLLTSMDEQNEPVVGSRFGKDDLNPKITSQDLKGLEDRLSKMDGVEDVTVNLKSATLRVHLNTDDNADRETVYNAMAVAKNVVEETMPFDTYFTNGENGKSYDIEIDAYNFIPQQGQSQDGWNYFKLTKTGAGDQVVDELSAPKNPELVSQITRQESAAQEPEDGELEYETTEGE